MPASAWTLDDLIHQETLGDWMLSPDGKRVAWNKGTVVDDERRFNLYLTDVATGATQQITRGKDTYWFFRWSPDGKRLAMLTSRRDPDAKDIPDEAGTQVWLWDLAGGEPYRLTASKRAVRAVEWRDNDTLVYLAEEDPTVWEAERKEKKDTTHAVEDAERTPPVRLFQIGRTDGKVRRLTSNTDWIHRFRLSPNGKRALVEHGRSLRFTWDQDVWPMLRWLDLDTARVLDAVPEGTRISDFEWTHDGRGAYVALLRTNHPRYAIATVTEAAYLPVGGALEPIDLGWERGISHGLRATREGFVTALEDGVAIRFAHVRRTPDGWARDDMPLKFGTPWGYLVSKDGRTLVARASRPDKPWQLVAATLRGGKLVGEKVLTSLNSGWKDKPMPAVEVVRFEGARGDEVEGILLRPARISPGKRIPLMLCIHGGPHSSDQLTWSGGMYDPYPILVQRGVAVLMVNYHGSSAYGLDFAESMVDGHYYDYPVEDLEKGVDALIERGLVDPDRVGTMGWSNGAILSAALIAHHPERYKVASLGAGGAEWVADWGFCAFGRSFSETYLGASPLEDPQRYIEMSPIYKFDRVTAPTIIFQGTEDRAVPPHHAWMQFRALQVHAKAPVRFLSFPGEGHGLGKIAHQRRKLEEEQAWFEAHFYPDRKAAAKPAVKDGSPLDRLLKRRAAASVDGRYGKAVGGVLTPEFVSAHGMKVARFEVTRAQFAAFDPAYATRPEHANLPATGVTFAQAKAYAEWLSEKLGKAVRLPNAEDAKKLYGDPAGNTLDAWAGTSLNPDDAAALRDTLRKLRPEELLAPVGHTEKGGVYDLDGNAAEWVEVRPGRGQAMGGSADQPADPRAPRRPGRAYTGLRVVMG